MQTQKSNLSEAIDLSQTHYENFPVASFLLRKNKRDDIALIYWFARTADDLADEGDFDDELRLQKLNEFEDLFTNSLNGSSPHKIFTSLSSTIKKNNLNPEHFLNLLKAFKMDVTKKRYKDFDELLFYCKHSANPVGRLILELFDIRDKKAIEYSDKICTALQLTNFYQDTEIDLAKGRIYYPLYELEKFGISEKLFELSKNNLNFQELLKFSITRTRVLFDDGKKLFRFLSGRLKLEIKWTVYGGEEILNKIEKQDYKVFGSRPELSKPVMIKLLLKSIIK